MYMTISPYVVMLSLKLFRFLRFLFFKPALFSRNLWPPHQKYFRISLKVFFFISFFKEFYHLERKGKSCKIYAVWQFFAQPPCRYFPRIILKLLWWFLRSSFRVARVGVCWFFFVVNCCRKLSLQEFAKSSCRCLKKKSQYRSRFRGASWYATQF